MLLNVPVNIVHDFLFWKEEDSGREKDSYIFNKYQ